MTIESLYEAYWVCRKNKGRTHSASVFEAGYEMRLAQLHSEVVRRTYTPDRSVTFIVTKPVQREIFAANFRDRIIHHWIALRIEPLLEEVFIPESCNCRKGKGNSAGIVYVKQFIEQESQGYTSDCWVMKLDLRGFFMSIDRALLTGNLCRFLEERYHEADKDTLLYLTRTILMNDPTVGCLIKGDREDWRGLPDNKSLFRTPPGFGLPIGNLTSQMSANFLLNETDHYIRETLGFRVVRYVDDYCLIDRDKDRLLGAVPLIRKHLKKTAGVELHPTKFYLQHYTKGVKFIGAVIKRDRVYISNRTFSNALKRLHYFNGRADEPGYVHKHAEDFVSSMNSYLGIMKHYSSYNRRKKLIEAIAPEWFRTVTIDANCFKLTVKKRFKKRERIKYALRN